MIYAVRNVLAPAECLLLRKKMSADEDTELRDLVAQTLETNGVLGKIRVRYKPNIAVQHRACDVANLKNSQ